MFAKAGITLLALVAIAPAARADLVFTPIVTATLKTDPSANPQVTVMNGTTVYNVIPYTNPYPPSLNSSFSQAGFAFDLTSLTFPGSTVPPCVLAFRTDFIYNAILHGGIYMEFPITYGMDTTPDFTASNFFGVTPPTGITGTAGVLRIPITFPVYDELVTFDVTNIVRNALANPSNRYLKFWVYPPMGGGYWRFTPTLSIVPEPSTVLLMGIGLVGVGLIVRGRKRPASHA